MSSGQRAIKQVAMVLALLLAGFIIFSILRVCLFAFSIYTGASDADHLSDFSQSYAGESITALEIDNWTGKVRIEQGDAFRVEGKNVSRSFRVQLQGGKLVIENKADSNWFGTLLKAARTAEIVITVADHTALQDVEIANGAGVTIVENLTCERFMLKGGAGTFEARQLNAGQAKIEGGVGSIQFRACTLGDAELECGVGSFRYEGSLRGKNQVTCGVGEVRLDLDAARTDYDIDITTGLGGIYIDGDRVDDDSLDLPAAPNALEIKGGVGRVDVDFAA